MWCCWYVEAAVSVIALVTCDVDSDEMSLEQPTVKEMNQFETV